LAHREPQSPQEAGHNRVGLREEHMPGGRGGRRKTAGTQEVPADIRVDLAGTLEGPEAVPSPLRPGADHRAEMPHQCESEGPEAGRQGGLEVRAFPGALGIHRS
jgi:hypothetical protein